LEEEEEEEKTGGDEEEEEEKTGGDEKEEEEGEEEKEGGKIMLIVSMRKSFSTSHSLSQNINYLESFSQWYITPKLNIFMTSLHRVT
jgi:hypothetical protein